MATRLEPAVRNTDRVVSVSPGQSLAARRTAQCDIQLDDPCVFDPAVAAAAVRLFARGEIDADAMPSEIRRVFPMKADG
jgi:hypothetical protein